MLGSNYLGQGYLGQGYAGAVPASTTGEGKLAVLGSVGNTSTIYTPQSGWVRQTLTFTAASADVYVRVSGSDANRVQWLDAVQLEQESLASTYFDGDSGPGYSWTGTPNNSASVENLYLAAVGSPMIQPSYSALMSFPQTVVTSGFFTIGTSLIGGSDIIKSAGSAVAFFDRYQYTDYTSYLVSMSVSQQIGQYPYGIMIATASVELDNSTSLFSPSYDPTIGAYILPFRPLKLSLGLGGESLQQFTGFTDQPMHDQKNINVSFTASDALNYICNYTSQLTSPLVGQTTSQIIAACLAEVGFTSSQYVLDASLQQPIGILVPYGQRWGDLLQYLCEAEQGLLFVDEYGIIRFWNRQHFTNNTTSVWNLDWTNLENLQSETTPIFNDVSVTATPRVVQANQMVWEQGTAVQIAVGMSYVYTIDFSDTDGSLPVTTADIPVGSAVGNSSYKANTASDGSGTDETGNVPITSAVLQGSSYVLTFQNNSGTSVYLTALSVYGTPAKVSDHISIRYTDSTSVSQYGTNPGNNGYTLQIQNDYIQDSSTANALAYSLVMDYKDGRTRYLAYPTSNPAIQIGDYVQVTNTDTGIVKLLYVVGRTVGVSNHDMPFTLELEERATLGYFMIGTSTIGGTDTLAP